MDFEEKVVLVVMLVSASQGGGSGGSSFTNLSLAPTSSFSDVSLL